MSDISNQLIKDSYNYVLQSDLSTGVVYRIGGNIPVNPIFQSGLTVNDSFTYSNGTEQLGFALLTDGTGYAYWGPISAATPSSGVTSITVGLGLSGNVTTGAVTLINTAPDQNVTITGGTNIEITGTYPDFGINYTGLTPTQGITGITATSGLSANTNNYATTIINTAPDQVVTISGGTGITTGGTYPNFTITNSLPDQTVVLKEATGISVSGTYPVFTITNTLPDKTVVLTGGTNIQIVGTYPNFGINFTGSTTGGTTSGDYLPLSGGTVTGGTIFQSGLTANTIYSSGQVGIGTSNPNAAAILELASTTQGVLFPRMTIAQRNAIISPPTGLILFVTDGDNEGLYIYKSTGWVQII
jgi:hypothetical protein